MIDYTITVKKLRERIEDIERHDDYLTHENKRCQEMIDYYRLELATQAKRHELAEKIYIDALVSIRLRQPPAPIIIPSGKGQSDE